MLEALASPITNWTSWCSG